MLGWLARPVLSQSLFFFISLVLEYVEVLSIDANCVIFFHQWFYLGKKCQLAFRCSGTAWLHRIWNVWNRNEGGQLGMESLGAALQDRSVVMNPVIYPAAVPVSNPWPTIVNVISGCALGWHLSTGLWPSIILAVLSSWSFFPDLLRSVLCSAR